MKIKIIDLLVKMANNEEVPKKIKYQDELWEYNEYYGDYEKNNTYLFEYLFDFEATDEFINDEVEIIKEPKKIKKCKNYEDFLDIDDYVRHLRNKINELIDEINKMKEGKQ